MIFNLRKLYVLIYRTLDTQDDDYDPTLDIKNSENMNKFEDIREIMLNYDTLKSGYKNKIKKITKYEIPTIA